MYLVVDLLFQSESSLHFQAHLQFTQAIAWPKIAKEPSNPSITSKKNDGIK